MPRTTPRTLTLTSNCLKMRRSRQTPTRGPYSKTRLDDRAAHAEIGGEADVVQHVFRLVVALEQRALAAGLEIEVEVDGDARLARPVRMRRIGAVAVEVAGVAAAPPMFWSIVVPIVTPTLSLSWLASPARRSSSQSSALAGSSQWQRDTAARRSAALPTFARSSGFV